MKNVSQIKFAQALAKAAALSEEDVAEDVVCPNVMQNIAVISTPAERNAIAYSKISNIFLGSTNYEVSAYTAAPEDTCKGVIRGVDVDISPAQLQSLIVHGRNPTALQAKRIKNSTTIVILFDGLTVPNYVICGTSMFRCTLFRRQTDVCYICGWVGHRADVCPNPEKAACRGCGKSLPSELHDCKPVCKLCGGPHPTADKKCRQRFQVPYIVRHRRHERQRQARSAAPFATSPDYNETEEDFPPLARTSEESQQRRKSRSHSRGGRPGSRRRSKSGGISRSRTPVVRIAEQTESRGTWTSKVKTQQQQQQKQQQPQVKGGTNPEQIRDAVVAQIQKENAGLRSMVEQLRAEIAELRKERGHVASLRPRLLHFHPQQSLLKRLLTRFLWMPSQALEPLKRGHLTDRHAVRKLIFALSSRTV